MAGRSTTLRAREQRNNPTACEAILWKAIRHGRLGPLKFRRQHPVAGYVVDFACPTSRLVVEVDGSSHANEEQAAFDRQRTEAIEAAGWNVVRVTNEQVLGQIGLVLELIEREARPNG